MWWFADGAAESPLRTCRTKERGGMDDVCLCMVSVDNASCRIMS